jgi:hypothetical protein
VSTATVSIIGGAGQIGQIAIDITIGQIKDQLRIE